MLDKTEDSWYNAEDGLGEIHKRSALGGASAAGRTKRGGALSRADGAPPLPSDFLIRAGLWGICQELKWHKNCHQLQQDRDSRATKVPTTFPARSGSLKFALATLRQEEDAQMDLRRRRVHADRHPEYHGP